MKKIVALLTAVLLLLSASFANAEKLEATPDYFLTDTIVEERKEDDNRRFVSKEYLITSNESVNAELREIADNFEAELFPTMQQDDSKNARRNSRLDIVTLHYITGYNWLSTMTLGRVSYKRAQVCSPFTTRCYDILTGERILLSDIFTDDSSAWDFMAERVRDHVSKLFPSESRNPDAIEQLIQKENLQNAEFTLSAMELTLHYEAKEVYPDRASLIHVRFFYDELRDMMTETARAQTDNSHWKMVAITCDDGPNYNESAKALTALRKAGARVTYFTVGKKLDEFSDMLIREFDENHIIASHSFEHWSGYSMKPERRLVEVQKQNDLLMELIGEPAHLFRAPGGTYPPWVEAGIGLPIIQWSVDSYDYTGKDAKHIFYSIRNNVQDGDVILTHETGLQMWKSVPLFAEYLQANGYLMVTVEELARANGVIMEPDTVYFRFLDGVTEDRPDSNTQR